MGFKIEAFQNRYLVPGSARVDAIVSVTADPNIKSGGELVVGFIIDKSGSMAGGRIEGVHHAVNRAISMLEDRTWFFVVAFDGNSYTIVRETQASAESKAWAANQVMQIQAAGGTAMSTGAPARRGRSSSARPMRSAARSSSRTARTRARSPRPCATSSRAATASSSATAGASAPTGRWARCRSSPRPCSARRRSSRRRRASRPAFREAMAKASGKALKDVRLRLWTPQGASIGFVKQVNPTIEELTAKARAVSPAGARVHDRLLGRRARRGTST